MLRLEGIDAGYAGTQVLRGIGLEAKQGVTTVLIGPNGAGKSTTLKIVNGLLRPTRGLVSFEGKDITVLPAHERAARGIASCPEGRRLFPLLTAEGNLRLGAYAPRARAAADETLASVYDLFPGLRERASVKAGRLSGGEQQMVGIGRALMSKPSILVLDEPSLGLAPKLVRDLREDSRIAARRLDGPHGGTECIRRPADRRFRVRHAKWARGPSRSARGTARSRSVEERLLRDRLTPASPPGEVYPARPRFPRADPGGVAASSRGRSDRVTAFRHDFQKRLSSVIIYAASPMFERPRGTNDWGPEDMAKRRFVESRFVQLAESFGFREVSTPTFESLDLFTAKSGQTIVRELYAFKDQGGRDLALRPEFTASILRFYVSDLRSRPKPLKLYSTGNVFRYEEPQI